MDIKNVICVNKTAKFAKYILTLTEENRQIKVFTDEELNIRKEKLDNINKQYTITICEQNQEWIDKCNDKIFNNRTDIVEYLTNDIIPSYWDVDILKTENKQLKQELSDTQDALLSLMFGGK